MKPETTVAIVNTAIVIMICACTIGVAALTGSAAGLWSMLALFFFLATGKRADDGDGE